jgi:hypothetical protein
MTAHERDWSMMVIAVSVLCLGGALWGAFATDPMPINGDSVPNLTGPGENDLCAYVAEIEAKARDIERSKPPPRQAMPGALSRRNTSDALLPNAVPVECGEAPGDTDAGARPAAACTVVPEPSCPWTLHIIAFVASLCFAGYAFWRLKFQYAADEA